jgi:exodeoxyribonuclease-5
MQGEPDVLLSEVHRQAAENPVLALATAIRSYTPWPVLGEGQEGLSYLGDATVSTIMQTLEKRGQVLCGRNATRVLINTRARQCLGYASPYPQPGDKLVCLQNNKDEGLLNGSLWFVRQVLGAGSPETCKVELQEDGGDRIHVTEMHLGKLNGGEATYFQTKGYSLFDYGYCLTVHKAQGSQWDDVLLVNESGAFKQEASRWLYTGVTRAAKSLTLCTNVKL